MTGIVLSSNEVSKRQLAIQKMFKPLVRSSRVEVFAKTQTTEIAYGLGHATNDLRKARHATRRQDLFLNYFEVWQTFKTADNFKLDKAYMHLHIPNKDGSVDDEVLALHSDPAIHSSDPAYKYKRGPHIHIGSARGSINKSHVALCLGEIDKVCSDIATFNSALVSAIAMINDEFMDRF